MLASYDGPPNALSEAEQFMLEVGRLVSLSVNGCMHTANGRQGADAQPWNTHCMHPLNHHNR